MAGYLAGIAVCPTGIDEYSVSVALVSSTDGSILNDKSTTSPIPIGLLTETAKSMILSSFNEPTKIKAYVISVPPAFPADLLYDVYRAIKLAKLIGETKSERYLHLPVSYGEAYARTLPKKTSILTLDFLCPDRLRVEYLSTREDSGIRMTDITRVISVPLLGVNTLRSALGAIHVFPTESIEPPQQILLVKPTNSESSITPKTIPINIDEQITDIYPNTPVAILTIDDIARATASFVHANFRIRFRYTSACGAPPWVSTATASGATVSLAHCSFIILTNSVDNQKSATVRLLYGNHMQAKDNFECGVAVLDGLKPVARGDARIRISTKSYFRSVEWKRAIKIKVEQIDWPKKKFLFHRFYMNLPENIVLSYEES